MLINQPTDVDKTKHNNRIHEEIEQADFQAALNVDRMQFDGSVKTECKTATYATLQPAGHQLNETNIILGNNNNNNTGNMKQEKFEAGGGGNFDNIKSAGSNRNESSYQNNQPQDASAPTSTLIPILASTPNHSKKERKSASNTNAEIINMSSSNGDGSIIQQQQQTHNMLIMINPNKNESSNQTTAKDDDEYKSSVPSPTNAQMEELNTRELAHKISSELKRYSIPQAVFAQRVLCRSQGTLSDLLRNPKPWSKLKSGRETFRRMYKWLQEPESQRMNSLRLAGKKKLTPSLSHSILHLIYYYLKI